MVKLKKKKLNKKSKMKHYSNRQCFIDLGHEIEINS